jgi:hypothetical protein
MPDFGNVAGRGIVPLHVLDGEQALKLFSLGCFIKTLLWQ